MVVEKERTRGHAKHDASESELREVGLLCVDVIYPQEA